MNNKIFVLDTNVMLHSPNCLETFDDNDVVIPAVCIEELDKFKNMYDLKGFYAREFIRNFEKIRENFDVLNGILLPSKGRVYIRYLKKDIPLPYDFEVNKSDNLILKVALQTKDEFSSEVILVSKDTNLRIKAGILGIKSEDYYHDKSSNNFLNYNDSLFVKDEIVDLFYKNGEVSDSVLFDMGISLMNGNRKRYILFKSDSNEKKGVLVKYNYSNNSYIKIDNFENSIGIIPTNYQQKFFIDALYDNNVKIIFAIGIAGTGKTLLSIASGLTQVLNRKYKKLIISRSPVPMGRDIGYLPGDINNKLDPWLKPIYDNLDLIIGNIQNKSNDERYDEKIYSDITLEYLRSSNLIEVEGLTYIRGRTFHNSFIIIDEAQNLTPHEVKTIITRVGKNSKIILTGDIYQIDNPYVDERDNGLTYASEKFKQVDSDLAVSVYLTKCERSEVSKIAASIL
ncbi:MAG: PhoH family protein [Calditerrivibrio sp.]|nr:PhoH family protein [Calditerrivibrio sp.]